MDHANQTLIASGWHNADLPGFPNTTTTASSSFSPPPSLLLLLSTSFSPPPSLLPLFSFSFSFSPSPPPPYCHFLAGNPVISVWFSPQQTFGFLEFRTVRVRERRRRGDVAAGGGGDQGPQPQRVLVRWKESQSCSTSR
eukprot:766213-Hanusia_phi.AAC.1